MTVFADCGTAEALIPKLQRDFMVLKTKIGEWQYDPVLDAAKLSLMKAVGKDMETWVTAFLAYANSVKATLIVDYPGKTIHTPTECQAIKNTLRTYESQLSDLAKRFTSISGQSVPDSLITPVPDVQGAAEGITDFAWSLLKIGIIGMVVWYGGKYLYNYLEQSSRYPQDKLPRYAGGSRKTSRRKRRRKSR